MTRKDYVKFAEAIKRTSEIYPKTYPVPYGEVIDFLRIKVADIFAADNPRFDRERFYQACEPKEKGRSE